MQVVLVQTGCLYLPSKFKDIEEQLRSLQEKPLPLQYLDNDQDRADVDGLLGDLQEAMNNYMVRS